MARIIAAAACSRMSICHSCTFNFNATFYGLIDNPLKRTADSTQEPLQKVWLGISIAPQPQLTDGFNMEYF
jgi:hypothetical protein